MKIVPAPQFFEGFSRLIRIPQAAICLTVRPKYSIFDRHTDRRTDSPIIGVFWCPFSFPSNTMSMESWCCPAVTTSATSPVASTKTSAAAISSSWPVVFSSVGTCFFLNDFDKFFLTLRRLLRTSIFFLLGVPEKQSLINWSLKKNQLVSIYEKWITWIGYIFFLIVQRHWGSQVIICINILIEWLNWRCCLQNRMMKKLNWDEAEIQDDEDPKPLAPPPPNSPNRWGD